MLYQTVKVFPSWQIYTQSQKNDLEAKDEHICSTLPRWLQTGIRRLGYSLFQKVITFARDSTKKDTVEPMNPVYFTVKFLYPIFKKGNIVLILLQIDTFHQIEVI